MNGGFVPFNSYMKGRDRDHKQAETPPDPLPTVSGTSRKRPAFPWKLAGGGIIALLLVWFIVQNSHATEVRLFWWRGTFPLVLVMATVAVATILAWETFRLIRRRRHHKKERAEP